MVLNVSGLTLDDVKSKLGDVISKWTAYVKCRWIGSRYQT